VESTNITYLRVFSPVSDGLLKMFERNLQATQTSSFEDFISDNHVELSNVAQGRDMSARQKRYAIICDGQQCRDLVSPKEPLLQSKMDVWIGKFVAILYQFYLSFRP
jgi:hypothetical protein